jgi:arginine decarboxylase
LKRSFKDLIEQTYEFPQTAFSVEGNNLFFHGIDLKQLTETWGSPLKLTYLPKIGEQIERSRELFGTAMKKCGYQADYLPSYCTKSAHFSHILEKVLANESHLEISSTFDTDIIYHLFKEGKLPADTYIICNGYKTEDYIKGIEKLMTAGMQNVIPVLDSMEELKAYESFEFEEVEIGLRMATEESANSEYYSSRFGIQKSKIIPFYKSRIEGNPKIKLRMLHFFVYSGMRDNNYYWNEVHNHVKTYTELKAICGELDSLNIGGGLPVQNTLAFDYDYQKICDELVLLIKNYCNAQGIEEPRLFTEFGSFTVGESGACIFKVLGRKEQNDRETWYILDNSLISTMPDMWARKHRFLMLPVNKWDRAYIPVNLGGLTCDNDDSYSYVSSREQLFLPETEAGEGEPLYIAFFHTGAYQETLSGYDGVHHCLIPSPKHLLIDRDSAGTLKFELFREGQQYGDIKRRLGYRK